MIGRIAILGRLRAWALMINGSFWFRPALLVAAAIALADLLVNVGRWDVFPARVIAYWLYNGGDSGARTLLGAIAGSAIGVAGTLFSITIATLTLASSQMGPRLLRNFTQDRGNQYTLGVFLGTFVYALIVLGSVHGGEGSLFVPHLAITGAVILALLCVAMLIYFVHHIASRINADTVIEMVFADLERSIANLTSAEPMPAPPDPSYWAQAGDVTLGRRGYIQFIDEDALADWAGREGAALQLLLRPGDFAFPGTCVARVMPPGRDPGEILDSSLGFGIYPTLSMDLEFAINQLVDIAVRALSPGINDPHTAMRVLDHLGAALCLLAGRHLPTGVRLHEGRVVYQREATDYAGTHGLHVPSHPPERGQCPRRRHPHARNPDQGGRMRARRRTARCAGAPWPADSGRRLARCDPTRRPRRTGRAP